MKVDRTPYCQVHNRHQTSIGLWNETMIYALLQNPYDCPCDKCDNPSQIEIDFEDGSI